MLTLGRWVEGPNPSRLPTYQYINRLAHIDLDVGLLLHTRYMSLAADMACMLQSYGHFRTAAVGNVVVTPGVSMQKLVYVPYS